MTSTRRRSTASPVPAKSAPETAAVPPVGSADLVRWVTAINALAVAVNEQLELGELLRMIARTACELLDYDAAGVLLVDEERKALSIKGSWGLSDAYLHRVNIQAPLVLAEEGQFAGSPSRRAFVGPAPVIVDDIERDLSYGPWTDAARLAGHRSMASVPLRSQQKVVGTINVYGTRPRQLSPEGLKLLEVLANHAGIALETTALLERERRRLDELQRLNDDLHRQAELLRAHARIHEQLIGVVQRGGGVTETVAELARLADRPVAVTDLAGTILASVAHGGMMVEPPAWSGSAAGSDALPDRASGVTVLAGSEQFPGLIAAPVRVGDELLGVVWAPGTADIGELQLRAMEQAAVVIGQGLLRRRARDDAQWQLRGDLLTEVLLGSTDLDAALNRADRVGSDLRLPHRLIAIAYSTTPEDLDIHRVLRLTRTVVLDLPRPRPLITRRESAVVLAVPDQADEASGESAAIQLAERLRLALDPDRSGAVRAAVSAAVSVPEFPVALRQVTGLLRLMPTNPSEPVLTTTRSGMVGLLLADLDPRRLSTLARRWIDPLRDHDRANDTRLLATLRAFLDHHQNTAATAAVLYVHPNTVNLRIKRCQQILGISLGNVDDLTTIRTAILIDDVINHS